jgi:competence protein ComEC
VQSNQLTQTPLRGVSLGRFVQRVKRITLHHPPILRPVLVHPVQRAKRSWTLELAAEHFSSLEAKQRSKWDVLLSGIESWLERRGDRIPLLLPVGIGIGIALWQNSGGSSWLSVSLACMGLICLSGAIGFHLRISRLLFFAATTILIGFFIIAVKSTFLSAPPIDNIWIGKVHGRVLSVEEQTARQTVRIVLETANQTEVPQKIRVNLPSEKFRAEIQPGAIVGARVRLMPPPGPALPGGYDFSRYAWFQGLGATGSVLGDVELITPSEGNRAFWQKWRQQIATHIERQMPNGSGPIGAAFLVGSRGGISEADNEALRNSGMAHLLSVSGLHVTAVVGGTFFVVSRFLALFPWLALRFRVPLMAAAAAALISIGYTLLTGAEVPTIRACVAALLVLVALTIGREAISLRLLAFGATIVLMLWPEALAGPSFQLSFSAVATIIILHESPLVRRWTIGQDEGVIKRSGRFLLSLLLTGIAIELVLAPIALFHFHKSGLYGALANIVAIPLTTFFIMPLQIFALLADNLGIGAPFWWLAGQGILLIRSLAYWVSAFPGAVLSVPTIPVWAFGSIIFGIVWAAIIQGRSGFLGVVAIGAGLVAMFFAPRPDMLLTGDGRHLAVIGQGDDLILLRAGAGDYALSMLSENAGLTGEPVSMERMPGASCSADICTFAIGNKARSWSVLATRSPYLVPAMEMAAACRRADIVISDRYLPWSCQPRWIKADRNLLQKSGGLAFYLDKGEVNSVAENTAHQPWSQLGRIKVQRELPRPKPQ